MKVPRTRKTELERRYKGMLPTCRKIVGLILRAERHSLSIALVLASPCLAVGGVSDTVRVWIPGKLVDFSPLCVGAIVGIYRNEGLEPEFIVIRRSRRLRGEFSFWRFFSAARWKEIEI